MLSDGTPQAGLAYFISRVLDWPIVDAAHRFSASCLRSPRFSCDVRRRSCVQSAVLHRKRAAIRGSILSAAQSSSHGYYVVQIVALYSTRKWEF